MASVLDSVGDYVLDSVWASEMKYYSFSSYGSISDYGWVSFYDFFQRIDILENKNFDQFKSLIRSGVYDMVQLKGICLVCGLPNIINRDIKGRLHSEKTSAIEFLDGYKLYFWKGTEVPEKLILDPDSVTKEDLNQANTEKRRARAEIN